MQVLWFEGYRFSNAENNMYATRLQLSWLCLNSHRFCTVVTRFQIGGGGGGERVGGAMDDRACFRCTRPVSEWVRSWLGANV